MSKDSDRQKQVDEAAQKIKEQLSQDFVVLDADSFFEQIEKMRPKKGK